VEMNESAICFWESIWFIKEMKPKYMFFEIPPLHMEFHNVFVKETGLNHILIDSRTLSAQSRKRWYFTNIPNLHQPEVQNITIDSIIPRAKAYSIHGSLNPNFGQPNQFKYGSRKTIIRSDGKMNTIVTRPHNTNKIIFPDGSIRIITPEESEQFMGYPIGHTNINGLSNTDRYRILGNGWSIPVIKHIFSGLSGVLNQPNLICNVES
jgi:site-specific DNA-cytosine methylase